MAYSTTLAYSRGYITAEERDEMVGLQVKVGLSVDHELFDPALLKKATEMILKTRDGKQWFAVPRPLGTCAFIVRTISRRFDFLSLDCFAMC
jgi:3-dehydroquinate synthase